MKRRKLPIYHLSAVRTALERPRQIKRPSLEDILARPEATEVPQKNPATTSKVPTAPESAAELHEPKNVPAGQFPAENESIEPGEIPTSSTTVDQTEPSENEAKSAVETVPHSKQDQALSRPPLAHTSERNRRVLSRRWNDLRQQAIGVLAGTSWSGGIETDASRMPKAFSAASDQQNTEQLPAFGPVAPLRESIGKYVSVVKKGITQSVKTVQKRRPKNMQNNQVAAQDVTESEDWLIDTAFDLRLPTKRVLAVIEGGTSRFSRLLKRRQTSVAKLSRLNVLGTVLALAVSLAQLGLVLYPGPLVVYITVGVLVLLSTVAFAVTAARSAALSLMLLPATQFFGLSVPLASRFLHATVGYVVLFALVVAYRFVMYTNPKLVKSPQLSKQNLIVLPLAIVGGQILGGLWYLALRHSHGFSHIPVGLLAGFLVLSAIVEELYFRGMVQPHAAAAFGRWTAAGMMTIVFAAAYVFAGTLWTAALGLLMGGLLALLYAWKQSSLLCLVGNVMAKLTFVGLFATFTLR